MFTEGKEKYRGMFETQTSGNKTSSGEIGLDIRTHGSPKVGQDQVLRFEHPSVFRKQVFTEYLYYVTPNPSSLQK